MKTKEELNTLKEEIGNMNKKLAELTDNELKQVNGGASVNGVNRPLFGTIILQYGGGAIPALAEMVCAIRNKNWPRVAMLANKPAIAMMPIVAEALAAART